jgi:hypothetical protein
MEFSGDPHSELLVFKGTKVVGLPFCHFNELPSNQ